MNVVHFNLKGKRVDGRGVVVRESSDFVHTRYCIWVCTPSRDWKVKLKTGFYGGRLCIVYEGSFREMETRQAAGFVHNWVDTPSHETGGCCTLDMKEVLLAWP